MPGPLPKPAAQRRRRNTPTIPTTRLPAAGRKGRAPKLPEWAQLGKTGAAFWRWAWSTPQAAAWDSGSHLALVRRAMLEDAIDALRVVDFGPLPRDEDGRIDEGGLGDYLEYVLTVCRTIKGLAGGQVSVMREARELDNTLGLNPKAVAALRWEIVALDAGEPADADEDDEVGRRRAEREKRLAARS